MTDHCSLCLALTLHFHQSSVRVCVRVHVCVCVPPASSTRRMRSTPAAAEAMEAEAASLSRICLVETSEPKRAAAADWLSCRYRIYVPDISGRMRHASECATAGRGELWVKMAVFQLWIRVRARVPCVRADEIKVCCCCCCRAPLSSFCCILGRGRLHERLSGGHYDNTTCGVDVRINRCRCSG